MEISDYNKCVDDHADGVYRFILKQIRDKDAAKDIVQDAFEKMWRKVETIEASKAKTYLFTTAYHTLVDFTRKQNRVDRISEAHELKHTYSAPSSDLREILNKGLDKLPEVQKTVLLLRDYEGYSYDEIGRITDLTESQVKVYIYRARTFLKSFIGSMEAVI